MAGLSSHLENETVGEAQGWPLGEVLESRVDDVRILDDNGFVLEEHAN